MGPLMTIGATMPVWRRPAMNVNVFQCPMGGSAPTRAPQGPPPLSRTMLVVSAVSSIKTSRAVSSQPCSRIQRRRARATSARFRSSARRLFFESDAMAIEKARQRASAPGDASLAQCRHEFIQRQVRLVSDQDKDLLRILLQRGRAPSTGHRFGRPIFAKALHPPDRRTRADLELFGRFTPRYHGRHVLNKANSQVPRIRSPHWPALRRINALASLCRGVLGIPIHSRWDAL